jgi:hypothetical protein
MYSIERQICLEKFMRNSLPNKTGNNLPKLKWTNKIVDYVEWIYALQSIFKLNGETVTLKTLFNIFNSIFEIDVKDFSLYFISIKNRKKGDRTSFLDLQKHLLMQRMDDADRKPSRK